MFSNIVMNWLKRLMPMNKALFSCPIFLVPIIIPRQRHHLLVWTVIIQGHRSSVPCWKESFFATWCIWKNYWLTGQSTQAVRLAGGAANSLIWAQIFADVFKLPVEIVDTKELGTLGCAMAAAVAAGVFKDLQEAAQTHGQHEMQDRTQSGQL